MTARRKVIPPQPVEIPKLWSVEKVAAHWSLKPDTLRWWARRGEIEHIKVGKLIMFEEAALVRFLEAKRVAS